VKSVLVVLAAAWFAYHALTFALPGFSGTVTDGEVAIGRAVQGGVRIVCAGLAVLSLAQIEWRRVARVLDRLSFGDGPTPPSEEW
jgi:hypothetical protein